MIDNVLYSIKNFFSSIYYWFLYRFWSKHKYHLIDTKLGYGYHEIDDRLIHGMFELLVDYVEIESGHIDHGDVVEEEIKELYYWWKVDRLHRDDYLIQFPKDPKGSSSLWLLDPKYENAPEHESFKAVAQIRYEAVKDNYAEDTNMLIRLIRIRDKLWS